MSTDTAFLDERRQIRRSDRGEIVATDGELLMRFLRHDDQQAFAEVVERHGPLVWLVCHQVLRHRQDVEDAFQATFLILAQRASAIRDADSAGSWLFKVAQRTALAARRKRARRREEVLTAEPPVGDEALPLIQERQKRFVLLDELRRLPVRYQTPLIMRYLEGRSRRAIAEQTDTTVGQVQGRLARGRRMLRSRLVRRGVSLSLAAGTVAAASASASASVTPMLITATAKSCLTLKLSGSAAGATTAAVELSKEGMKAMWCATMMKSTAAVGALLLCAGIGLTAQQDAGEAGNGAPASGVALQVASDEAAKPDAEPLAVTNLKSKSETQAEPNEVDSNEPLAKTISEYRDRIEDLTREMGDETTKLEMQRVAKSLTQREVEGVHGLMMELDLESLRSGDTLTDEQKRQREERRKALDRKLEEVTEELESVTYRTARTESEVKALDMELAHTRQILSDLQRKDSLSEVPANDPTALLQNRFKHRVPWEVGFTETAEGVDLQIDEVRGTRAQIEVGGHYLICGKCTLPPGQRGRLYFWLTTTSDAASAPTANTDLQSVLVDSDHGEFTLMNSMQGPGYFHLRLVAADNPSRMLANVYLGTGETVLREKP